ncbi:MAG: hypothetical protein IJ189_09250 [Clostridia bacterium]|nr:hypothetical protein [Clostridia bacterium]
MLRSCSKNEFDEYIDFAYELATDLTRSGYPTYCDGIKTKAMFVERSLKAFERETEHMLLFVYEGEVQGLIHYYWIPDDHYFSTVSFNISRATEQALSEFLAYVGERFKGYDVFLGFPAENSAVKFLAEQGFECIENDYNNTAFLDRFDEITENNDLIRIDKENYESFKTLHCQIEGDMYWNSERLFADLDNWVIFVKDKNGKPQGAVYYYMNIDDGWFEIFGIDIHRDEYNPQLFMELLNAALFDAKRRNGKVMTFFCDKEYEEAVIECGFTCVGNYLCYKTHIE